MHGNPVAELRRLFERLGATADDIRKETENLEASRKIRNEILGMCARIESAVLDATGKLRELEETPLRSDAVVALLKALQFSAHKHRDQRRKDAEGSPYINHPIEMAEILARVGGITDLVTLQGAILHDTIEDTQTTPGELETELGPEVRALVEEVSDDKRLPKEDRKRLQIEHALYLSPRAKQIKIADKICNIHDVTHSPPSSWSWKRRLEYLDWTERVVAGCRGVNRRLEEHYDEKLREGRRILSQQAIS